MNARVAPLLAKYNVPGPRYTSYPTVPYWERTPSETEWIDALRAQLTEKNGVRGPSGAAVYVQPTVTFVYPPKGHASEDTPVDEVLPILRSALVAERETERFARAGGRGVVLRFGLLDGPGTGIDEPMQDFGATLHVTDAARALLAALTLPSGIYNVCRDGGRVSSERFTRAVGWQPQR